MATTGELLGGDTTRLSFALRAANLGYWEHDLVSGELMSSDIFKTNLGHRPDEPLPYDSVLKSIHPDDLPRQQAAVEQAFTSGKLDVEYRAIWPDGSTHWLHVRGETAYGPDRKPIRLTGVSLDITDQKHVEEDLREETRALETIHEVGKAIAGNFDIAQVVQMVTDACTKLSGAQFGAFFYNVLDEKGAWYTLYTISGVPRSAFEKYPMPRNTAVFEPTFKGTGIVRSDDIRKDPRYGKSDPHFGMPKGHLPVVSYLAVPVISRDGSVIGGLFFGHEKSAVFSERVERIVAGIAAQAAVAIDNARLFDQAKRELAERKRIEEHQELLLAELNHRVKNTLAIVMSIATQTLRHSSSAEAFRTGFEARIMALAEAHNLLTDSNWEGSSLRAILDRVLGPYRGSGTPRYIIAAQGDQNVGPKTAVALVMAFNELATNAVKYGALSKPDGQVTINWSVSDRPERRLEIVWKEAGGPPVKTPSRKGFGSRLIRGLAEDAGGRVNMDFERSGLIATFDLPMLPEGAETA